LNSQFSEEKIQKANKSMKKCSPSLAIKKYKSELRSAQSFWPSPRKKPQPVLVRGWEKGNPHVLLGETSATTMEISMEVPQKTKNKLIL
jgi:hypothetical protein